MTPELKSSKDSSQQESREKLTEFVGYLNYELDLAEYEQYWIFRDLRYEPGDWDGVHSLHNGDRLTIFDKDDPQKTVWEGAVEFIPASEYKEMHPEDDNPYLPRQKDVGYDDWVLWFRRRFPAKLKLGDESLKRLSGEFTEEKDCGSELLGDVNNPFLDDVVITDNPFFK